MAAIDMKYFMRDELLSDEIIEVPGLEIFKDDKGCIIPFQIRTLGVDEINKIRKQYTKNIIVVDEKGKRVFNKQGEPLISKETDNTKATNRIIVESLIVPNLKSEEIRKFYGCNAIDELPMKIFKRAKDYAYVSEEVMKANGISGDDDELEEEELIESAKN